MASLRKITIIIQSLGVLSRRKMVIFYFIWLCLGCFLENQSKCRTDLGAGRKPFVDGRVLREAFPFHACATCAFYTAIKNKESSLCHYINKISESSKVLWTQLKRIWTSLIVLVTLTRCSVYTKSKEILDSSQKSASE